MKDKILIDINEVMEITGLKYDSAAALVRDTNALLKKKNKNARVFRGFTNKKLLLEVLGEEVDKYASI